MFIRATSDFETAVFNVRKGQLVDMDDATAQASIRQGLAVAVTVERAIEEMAGVEHATATPQTEELKRGPGRPRKVDVDQA